MKGGFAKLLILLMIQVLYIHFVVVPEWALALSGMVSQDLGLVVNSIYVHIRM